MPMDPSKLKEAFLSEANAYISAMNNTLVELEKSPGDVKLFHEVFRAAHTLKSLAGAMSYKNTMDLCHAMEDVLDAIKNNQLSLDKCTDILFQCFDHLSANSKSLAEKDLELNAAELIEQLHELLKNGKAPSAPQKAIRVAPPIKVEKLQVIEVKVERLDILMNLAEELLVCKMRFDSIREEVEHPELSPAVELLGRLITELQYYVMQIRMVPIEFIFTRFIRMARDLAKQQKKEVKLETVGGDIELDRMLIDEIGESIAHLIRNAVDHGLETIEERKKQNKPSEGTLLLRASRTKESVVIEIIDDGAGLDMASIRNLGLKNKLIKEDAKDEEIVDVIFSGLSTKKNVTEISGRGMGLAIVKQKIESIGGSIHVKSVAGQGTHFSLEIPLKLAIINTLFIKVGDNTYALPIDFVERLLVVSQADFKGLINNEAIIYEGASIPVTRLAELFGIDDSRPPNQAVVIIQKNEIRLGLPVDGLLSTQEIVIKPLGKSVRNNKYFAGAALVGSGEMVLVLDVAALLQTTKRKKIPGVNMET